MKNQLAEKAKKWILRERGENFLKEEEYCSSRDIFQARLDKMRLIFESVLNKEKDLVYLVVAVAGEIGNNSFDHNLGKWRDTSSTFFVFNYRQRIIVLADRGQGIYSSIKKALPGVKNDLEAIKIAFTKRISGRQPEKRGNGLKFVASVAKQTSIEVFLQSGKASARANEELLFQKENDNLKGVLAIIQF